MLRLEAFRTRARKFFIDLLELIFEFEKHTMLNGEGVVLTYNNMTVFVSKLGDDCYHIQITLTKK